MKTRGIFLFFSILLSIAFTSQYGCNEEDPEPKNSPPTCEIKSPSNGEEITKGEQIVIAVDANDSDGEIDEVRFYIDEIGVGSESSFPYNYTWSTGNEELGNHFIKAISEDDENVSAIDEIQISIVESGGGTGEPCPGMPTVTDIDGNVYNTVLIGNQCWMKENLKTTTYNNGTPIPNVTDNDEWENLVTGAYVWYDNDIGWKDPYSALYNWHATVNNNGLCPTGWHIPTNIEWTLFTNFIGGINSPKGNEIKSCRQVNSPLGGDCNTNEHPRWDEHVTHFGKDFYNFSCLPGGIRMHDGQFYNIGEFGYWWSSEEFSSIASWCRRLMNYSGIVDERKGNKRMGYSVRCIKD